MNIRIDARCPQNNALKPVVNVLLTYLFYTAHAPFSDYVCWGATAPKIALSAVWNLTIKNVSRET
jgi:hypothetical protein